MKSITEGMRFRKRMVEYAIRNFETTPPPQTQTIHISQCLRDVFLSIYESFACTSFHIVV